MAVGVDEALKGAIDLFFELKNWLGEIFIENIPSGIVRIRRVPTQNYPVLLSLLFIFYAY
jgi:hypothetical protein